MLSRLAGLKRALKRISSGLGRKILEPLSNVMTRSGAVMTAGRSGGSQRLEALTKAGSGRREARVLRKRRRFTGVEIPLKKTRPPGSLVAMSYTKAMLAAIMNPSRGEVKGIRDPQANIRRPLNDRAGDSLWAPKGPGDTHPPRRSEAPEYPGTEEFEGASGRVLATLPGFLLNCRAYFLCPHGNFCLLGIRTG